MDNPSYLGGEYWRGEVSRLNLFEEVVGSIASWSPCHVEETWPFGKVRASAGLARKL